MIWSLFCLILKVTVVKENLLRMNCLQRWEAFRLGNRPVLMAWQDLGDVLVLIFNENFHLAVLTGSQHEGLLRLLYKKNHQSFVKNWHGVHYLS